MLDTPRWVRVLSLSLIAAAACEQEATPAATPGPTQGGSAGATASGTSGTGGAAVTPSAGQAGSSAGATAGMDTGGATSAGTSAGGSSAGAAGASPGGSGGSVSVVACTGSNFCDGFEAVQGTNFGSWKQNGTDGTLKADMTHVFSGQQAMQFVSNPGATKRVQLELVGAPLFPVQNNKFWGRVMAWAEDLPGMSDKEAKNVHYDLVQGSGNGDAEYRVAGMGGVLLNYNPHDCYYGTQKPIPEGRWACWEWLFDGSTNTIEFHIDSVLQASVVSKGQGCVDGTSSVWAAPTFNELRIGFVNYQSKAETTKLWLDDFAAGPERIGCPAALPTSH